MLNLLHKYKIESTSVTKLTNYVALLMKWNSKIQMTATKSSDEFIDRHIVDSLELAEQVDPATSTMLDVGSGGGLPGIVLAIVKPNIEFLLIEPTRKKHAFLSTARRELNLSNLRTLAIRDEELIKEASFRPFDAAVARAVWSVEKWLKRAPRLVRAGGSVYAMEGSDQGDLTANCTRYRYLLNRGRRRSIIHMKTAA